MTTLDELAARYEAHNLKRQFNTLVKKAKNSIRLQLDPCADEEIPLGRSKLGGAPDLPAGMDWPCRDGVMEQIPLSFVGQINFAEVKPFDLDGRLPERGILYFFYDYNPDDGMPWGFDPKDADGKHVLYVEDDSVALCRLEQPGELEDEGLTFDSARLSFRSSPDLPDPFSDAGGLGILLKSTKDRLYDLMDELEEEAEDPCVNKLLGYPNQIQGDMQVECQIVTQGYYAGNSAGYAEARAKGAHKNADRWQLLLQVDSNEELGMMWGDCGRLYLWITEEDLRRRDFDHTWLILQCG